MPTGTILFNGNLNGFQVDGVIARTGGGEEAHEVTLPAGSQASVLSKTDADTAVLTVPTVYGLQVDDVVDVYWSAGLRIGLDVTVVDGTAVTVDGGAGDDLPANSTVLVVTQRVTVADVNFDGDSMKMLVVSCDQRCSVDFEDVGNASVGSIEVPAANEDFQWADGQGVTRPITGNAVHEVQCSNASYIAAATLYLAAILTS